MAESSDEDFAESNAKVKREQTQMRTLQSLQWLRSRHQTTANQKYLKSLDQVEQDQNTKDVFSKIDYDQSGTIEISELNKVFVENGLYISNEELIQFFGLCKSKSMQSLTLAEFGELYNNDKADELFRSFIKRSR